ncbi:MAG: type II secretion system F family protein [Bdellovibrionaceae bacterium]|jgi:type IV pilus assembly protein PilC|nr:type II secretion system F family protein [Pseudobdellovibrionaceae bacterium]
MPKFVFRAKAFNGKLVRGEIDAKSQEEARVKLRSQKLIPSSINEKVDNKLGAGRGGDINFFAPKVTPKELQVFTRQFAVLISSGVPIVQSIQALSEGNSKETELVRVLRDMNANVEKGKRLAETMLDHPRVFDRTYVNLVKAGEEGGVLETVLERLAGQIEKNQALASKVKGALGYPMAIIVVAMLVIAAIMIWVIPSFVQLFAGSGKELPYLTVLVMDISDFFVAYWYIIIPSLILIPIGFVQYYKTPEGRKVMDAVFIATPMFGALVQKSAIAKFSRTLSTLLASGVRIVDCLEIAAATSGNWVVEKAVLKSKESINKGRTIVEPLMKEKYIPEMVTKMISIGEQTGNIDTMLGKVADFYEDEVEIAADSLTSMIEPLLMVVLGGIIAVLVVAMYLPIFDLAGNV